MVSSESSLGEVEQLAQLKTDVSEILAKLTNFGLDAASAQKYLAEAAAIPEELRQEMIKIITTDVDEANDRDFRQRVEIARLLNAEGAIQARGSVQ